MGIYALITLPGLVCLAAGSRPPRVLQALQGQQGSIFYGSKSLFWVRASCRVPGGSCGNGLVCDTAV